MIGNDKTPEERKATIHGKDSERQPAPRVTVPPVITLNSPIKTIYHFGDTHTLHGYLNIPKGIDLAIFSGDCSNPADIYLNSNEVKNFIEWYSKFPAKYKIFVAGNHDGSIEKKLITKKDFQDNGIIYLENEYIEIEGIKIWGSPITPTFGNWYFMKKRDKLHDLWATIPDDTDIIITHGPPKTILDLSISREGVLEFCGCEALRKRIEKIKPRFVLFGHIHNFKDIKNSGIYKCPNAGTVYSNGSCVTDAKFNEGLSSHGNVLEYRI